MYLNENLCYILSLDESSLPFISFPVALPCSQRLILVFLGIFFAFSRWLVISTLARKKMFSFFFCKMEQQRNIIHLQVRCATAPHPTNCNL